MDKLIFVSTNLSFSKPLVILKFIKKINIKQGYAHNN